MPRNRAQRRNQAHLLADLARRVLTAACWAAHITVTGDDQHAQLVTIDVIRH